MCFTTHVFLCIYFCLHSVCCTNTSSFQHGMGSFKDVSITVKENFPPYSFLYVPRCLPYHPVFSTTTHWQSLPSTVSVFSLVCIVWFLFATFAPTWYDMCMQVSYIKLRSVMTDDIVSWRNVNMSCLCWHLLSNWYLCCQCHFTPWLSLCYGL